VCVCVRVRERAAAAAAADKGPQGSSRWMMSWAVYSGKATCTDAGSTNAIGYMATWTDRDRQTETDRQTEADRQRQTDRERECVCVCVCVSDRARGDARMEGHRTRPSWSTHDRHRTHICL
jgi:hypothetical protein